MTKKNTDQFVDDNFGSKERREQQRYEVKLDVNYRHGDTYLFSRISNVSEFCIFLVTDNLLEKGTIIEMDFPSPGINRPVTVQGEVMWIENSSDGKEPGMGIKFINLSPKTQKRIKSIIRIVAYID